MLMGLVNGEGDAVWGELLVDGEIEEVERY